MELGQKILQARQEAGLSQRQLCGDIITRNMLSQIEHGTARPSMDTLQALAARLEKPVSYFLEEKAAISPNQDLLEQARAADPAEAWLILKGFRHPDPILSWEWKCRSFLAALAATEQAMQAGKRQYARQLLEEAAEFDHGIPDLERKRLLLLAELAEEKAEIISRLPAIDEELRMRAEAALQENRAEKAMDLLRAMENRENPRWYLLMGQAHMQKKEYEDAVVSLQKAEEARPEECVPLLEECFRELGDFKQAYAYACKQK